MIRYFLIFLTFLSIEYLKGEFRFIEKITSYVEGRVYFGVIQTVNS
jgi:hypothetical protein